MQVNDSLTITNAISNLVFTDVTLIFKLVKASSLPILEAVVAVVQSLAQKKRCSGISSMLTALGSLPVFMFTLGSRGQPQER